MNWLQERKKCEFVEGLLEFTRSWVTFYQRGNAVALEYADYLADLATRHTMHLLTHFTSVSDPDSFFTDPDPGFFPRSGSRQQKTNFSKAKTKFLEKSLFSTQKVGILFLFSTNQVGILLNRGLLFGIIFKNK